MKKILVVGGVAGGASAAARIRRLDTRAEIIMFERGPHVSFSNCSLPYYIGGVVEKEESLLMMTPAALKKRFNIETRVFSEVVSINREAKSVRIRDLKKNEEYEESYDILILATGASPIKPASIEGIDSENVFTIRNVVDIARLKARTEESQKIAVIGGGFIGLEIAENLRLAGKEVVLVEASDQIMAPLDYDMAQTLHKEMADKGVELKLETSLKAVKDDGIVVSARGKEEFISADGVVLAIGVAPEKKLAEEAGLKCGKGVIVNHNYQTDDPAIYAVGDVVESYDRLSLSYGNLPLAGPAQRQARAAADHICGIPHSNKGYIGSSCLKLFDQTAACTGLNTKKCDKLGIPYDYVYILPGDKVGLMPDSHYMGFKLIFEVPTGRILGAQAVGKGDVTKRIDVIAGMITMNATLEDLKELELCYAPAFNTAKGVENIAALVGLNVLYGKVKQVHVSDVRALAESGAYIIDVREEREFAAGHIKNAVNIPLSQFSERIEEVPKDRPVYLHCRSSQRSYYAICQLQGAGYTNAYNISGSFLGISLYEWFNDVRLGREPIVTEYNFK